MSKYLPYSALQKEQIAQSIRRVNGIKNGSYVRVQVGPRHTQLMSAKQAKKAGLTPLTEAEFQALVNPGAKVEASSETETKSD